MILCCVVMVCGVHYKYMSVEDVAAYMDEGLTAMRHVEALGEQCWGKVVLYSGEFYEMGRGAENIRATAGIIYQSLNPDLTGVPLKECETAAAAYSVGLEGSDALADFEAGIAGSSQHFENAADISEAYRQKLNKIQRAALVLGRLISEAEPLHKQLLKEVSNGGKAARPVIALDGEYRARTGMQAGETGA